MGSGGRGSRTRLKKQGVPCHSWYVTARGEFLLASHTYVSFAALTLRLCAGDTPRGGGRVDDSHIEFVGPRLYREWRSNRAFVIGDDNFEGGSVFLAAKVLPNGSQLASYSVWLSGRPPELARVANDIGEIVVSLLLR